MATNVTDAQITKWVEEYERSLVAKHNLICDRWSLEIISGIFEYELPNYITNIRAVYYLGKEIHPKGNISSIMTGDIPYNQIGGIPYEYVVTGKGRRVMRLMPAPNQAIPVYTGDLFSIAADRAGCIIEFYRTPDITDSQLMLPDWMRRYLCKDYVCYKAFSAEGQKQDLRAAIYYTERMSIGEQYIKEIQENMHKCEINIIAAEHKFNRRQRPHRPILPTNFGYPTTY